MLKQDRSVVIRTSCLAFALVLGGVGCSKDSSSGSDQPAASATPSAEPTASAAPAASGSDTTATGQTADNSEPVGDDYDDQDPSALSDFHSALDSKGTWTEDPKVGTVWVPAPAVVGADFVPYRTGGHWVYGDDYTWISDWEWGWAPFHYGRWVPMAAGGWGWIPGRVYAPAWVTWRVGAPGFAYVGWAPMAPVWGWRAGVATPFGFAVTTPFSYCATVDLFHPGLAGRVVVGAKVGEAERGTHVWDGEGHHGDHDRVGGPPPSRVGIPDDKVKHAPPNDPQLKHAQNFSKPSSASALGGHPPSKVNAKKAPNDGTLPNKGGGGLPENKGDKPENKPENNKNENPGGGGKPGGGNKGGGGKPKH